MVSNLATFFGFGFFLLCWETLDLMFFSLTNSFWTTCIFMAFGSFFLITGTLALVSQEKGSGNDALTWKQFVKATLRNPSPSAIFYLVNALSGIFVLLLAIPCLNSSTSMYFQEKTHGKSVVEFPIDTLGSPHSIIIKGTSIVDFYNARASTQGVVEYTHNGKKYCAIPIVALTYRKRDQSSFWARCQISRKESCQDIRYSSSCTATFDAPIYAGQRVSEKEEKDFNEQLNGGGDEVDNKNQRRDILVDAQSKRITLWGLWYYALNLLWVLPTATALVYENRRRNAFSKE